MDSTSLALATLTAFAVAAFELVPASPTPTLPSKKKFYADLLQEIEGIVEGQRNYISNLANCSALIYHGLLARKQTLVNWVGFYLRNNQEGELLLGPFQGEVACVVIRPGKGVCGTAAALKQTVLVPNVHEFPGHIACSDKTNSEIVIPLLNSKNNVVGVLDLDAVNLNGFDHDDQEGLEAIATRLMQLTDWPVDW